MQSFLHRTLVMAGLTAIVMPVEVRKVAPYEAFRRLQGALPVGEAGRRRRRGHGA